MATIKFWGVRGSIPTPGKSTVKYGGNTSCVEIRHDGKLFILDAGSGIRELGLELLKTKKPVEASIFISHVHWDHIQGIPFFTPAYIPGNNFVFYGSQEPDKDLFTIIRDQMDLTYFPIELQDMSGELDFRPIYEGTYEIQNIRVDTIFINHPGNALGYKFHFNDRRLVYISDNEPFPGYGEEKNSTDEYIGESGDEKLIEFIKGSHVLIHDAQYTPEEYKNKKTWGHSPYTYTVDLALRGDIEHLVLYHHDPMHDDDFVDTILKKARAMARGQNDTIKITAAKEGSEIPV